MIKRIWQIATFIFVVLIIYLVSQQTWLQNFNQGGLEELVNLVQDNIVQAFIFLFLLMLVQNLFTLIPLPAIIGLAVIADPENTELLFLWTFGASLIGATIAFYLARLWLHKWAMNKMNIEFKQKLNRSGFMVVFILRILPFVPTSLINYSAGVSSVRFLHYILATATGNFIYFLILFFIGKQIIEVGDDTGVMILIAIVAVVLFILYYKLLKPRMMKSNN